MVTATASALEGLRLLGRHGGIIEIRLLRTKKGTVSGYFDNLERAAQAVTRWDGIATIYATANPVNPTLLARADNRLKEYARITTSDADVLRRAWFPVDLDPVRPAGISATDAEVAAAITRRNELVAFLSNLDFPAPVLAMSGNGAHALWSIDLPNDEPTRFLCERALAALHARFSDEAVHVDETVFNAARIWKVYGTVAMKGDATADRPHRRATLDRVPEPLVELPREALERLAAMASRPTSAAGGNGSRPAAGERFDLVGAFTARGWYKRALLGGKHAVDCPWASGHSGDSGVTESCLFEPKAAGDPWGYDCRHAHCADRTIRDVLVVLGLAGRNGHNGRAASWREDPWLEDPPAADTEPLEGDDGVAGARESSAWPIPEPVSNDLPPVPTLDVPRLVPEGLAPWIIDIAERAQCPPDFVATAAIVALGSVVGRALAIRPKAHDDWTVVPNLWGGGVGRPGIMKTPAMQEALNPT